MIEDRKDEDQTDQRAAKAYLFQMSCVLHIIPPVATESYRLVDIVRAMHNHVGFPAKNSLPSLQLPATEGSVHVFFVKM